MKLPVWKPLYIFLKLLGAPVEWEKSVGAVLFRMNGGVREYLLLRYPSGHYEFPRGHTEGDETEEETLRREVEEETGIKDIPTIYPFRLENRFFYVAGESEQKRRIENEGKGYWVFKRTYLYPAMTTEAHATLSFEHTDFVWLPYAEALERLTFDNAKGIFRKTEAYLKEMKETSLPKNAF